MILLRHLAWMHWRGFVNGVSRRRKGSASQRRSAWMDAGATMIVSGFGLLLATLFAAAGFGGGMLLVKDADERSGILIMVRVVVVLALLMALISPLQGKGEGRSPSRLLLLPVSLRELHVSSILASAADPLIVLTMPAMFAVLAGMAWAGATGAALTALPAMVALAAFLVGFDALVGFGSQLLLRDRRRGEATALVALLILIAVGFLPAVLASRMSGSEPLVAAASPDTREADVEAALGALDLLPPGLVARAVQRALDGRPTAALGQAALLSLFAAAGLAGSAAVHARLLSEPGRTSRRRAIAGKPPSWLRLPGIHPLTLAIAATSSRTALRTVRGKLAVFTPPIIAGAMVLVFRNVGDSAGWLVGSMTTGAGLLSWCVALALLNQQPLALNAWAVDRAGFARLALLPVTDVRLVRGKMLGQGLLLLFALVPAVAVALAIGAPSSADAWLMSAFAAVAAWLLHSPIALMLSAWFPKAADMSKLSGQQPHGAAALLGALSIVAAMALPRLAGIAGTLTLGPWGGPASVMAWCALTAVVALPATGLAASLLAQRREAIAMAAQGR